MEQEDFLQFEDMMSPSVSEEVPEELRMSPSRNDDMPQQAAEISSKDVNGGASTSSKIIPTELDEFGRVIKQGSDSETDMNRSNDVSIKRTPPKRRRSRSPRDIRNSSASPKRRSRDRRRGDPRGDPRHHRHEASRVRDDETKQPEPKRSTMMNQQQVDNTGTVAFETQADQLAVAAETQTIQYPNYHPHAAAVELLLQTQAAAVGPNIHVPHSELQHVQYPVTDNYILQQNMMNLPPPPPPASWGVPASQAVNGSPAHNTSEDEQQSKKDKHNSKLVRVAITEYVKEALKPTWKEGNMTKEVYKTIVKKAVDKVTSTLKPHQIPRTQDKVEHFMTFSRQKISKLVQGYVEKYQKP